MEFLSAFASYLLVFVAFVVAIAIALVLGISFRKHSDKKKANNPSKEN